MEGNPYIENRNRVIGLKQSVRFKTDEINALRREIADLNNEIDSIENSCTHTIEGKSSLVFCHYIKSEKVSRCSVCNQYVHEDLRDYSKPCDHIHTDGRNAIINTGQFAGNVDVCEICDQVIE